MKIYKAQLQKVLSRVVNPFSIGYLQTSGHFPAAVTLDAIQHGSKDSSVHAHTLMQSVGAEVRYDLFFWEFTVICEESERDYWNWTRWLFPAGRLADLGLLACTYYDDSVSLCWLTTHQAHWLPAGLQGWLPVWLLPLLNVLKTVGPAAY